MTGGGDPRGCRRRFAFTQRAAASHGSWGAQRALTDRCFVHASLRNTLTWDQGAEMSEHRAFSTAVDMDVYFCDPASPWQRGSNENTNGLVRQ